MVLIESYMQTLKERLKEEFGPRLLYVGLQGSYLRGEATETSDIDVMTVLDILKIEDLDRYRNVISHMEESEKACGFLCGKEELAAWQPYEIFHLVRGTKDYYGKLEDLVPTYNRQDVIGFVKICAGNLYHELCHRYIFESPEQNREKFPDSCKQIFYLLQTVHYLRTGEYALSQKELIRLAEGVDQQVIQLAAKRKGGGCCFETAFPLVFEWCRGILKEVF